jgi:hypothetical protein
MLEKPDPSGRGAKWWIGSSLPLAAHWIPGAGLVQGRVEGPSGAGAPPDGRHPADLLVPVGSHRQVRAPVRDAPLPRRPCSFTPKRRDSFGW